MENAIVFIGAVVAALVIAFVLQRRRSVQAPTQGGFELPTQLDRGDFVRPDAPWIVVAFTSATCSTCADIAQKISVLESREVAVMRVDYPERKDLHTRYRIEAVPSVVIADAAGSVHNGFMGPIKAQDLWAAVAECREPGSTPPGCSNH